MALSPARRAPQAGGSGATIQGGGKKKKNKNRGRQRPQAGASIAAAATGGQNACGKFPQPQGGDNGSCPVHPNVHHSTADSSEIQKLAKCVSGRREQGSKDGSAPPPG